MTNITLVNSKFENAMHLVNELEVDAVIADPPYTHMVNENWDRRSEDYYRTMFKCMVDWSYSVLRYGGRFLSFSSNDTLRYLYNDIFRHRELLVIEKCVKKVSSGRNTRQYKQHINCTEYVYVDTKFARPYIRQLLLDNQGDLKSLEINTHLGKATNGGGMWSIFTGNNICGQIPTRDMWVKLKEIMSGLPEFESFEEVFNNDMSLSNIYRDYSFNFRGRIHRTQKPQELYIDLLNRYTRPNDLVLDMFMGSGALGVACHKTNRRFIGIEECPVNFEKSLRWFDSLNIPYRVATP